jgi:hypothetical protein
LVFADEYFSEEQFLVSCCTQSLLDICDHKWFTQSRAPARAWTLLTEEMSLLMSE